ncbi:flagellar hook capping FlgD N-terminal domain-containing protein [Breoghania sp. L-A4]|uniref:flagellar hook assembly protein FlgD n=1 Tax=Breoghania sp. L-A4 TaxID=2304600 RepID=UPI000E35E202|nr:flagellar hook capping FlgD N-terminal domain-containing protein [Breoghania sp. L-A4]AXS41485.1 flagellar hook assembly protein FlgD [Breoghania sp. L-A4]
MDVSGASSTTKTTGGASNDSATLSSNYEMFLTLLTTQLKVQDPLDPMNADDFTNQLVQYSAIEQQIKTNANLDELISSVQSQSAAGLVSYLGTKVVADGVQSVLEDGEAVWGFTSGAGAETAEISIRNSDGAVMFTEKIEITEGSSAYVWDGRTNSGVDAPDGTFSISIAAKDGSGNAVSVDTQMSGVVDGIDLSGTEPILKVGGALIPLSSIHSVSRSL